MFTTDFVLSYVTVGNQDINYKFINVSTYFVPKIALDRRTHRRTRDPF